MKQPARTHVEEPPQIDTSHVPKSMLHAHDQQIRGQIQKLGADFYDLKLPETKVLPLIIHPNEQIRGIVYGKYKHNDPLGVRKGRGVLMATDRRVLLIDSKPMFLASSEISYEITTSIGFTKVGFMGTIVLRSRIGDISIRTFNMECARNFVEAIERRLERYEERTYDYGGREGSV